MRGAGHYHGHFYQPPRENPWTGQGCRAVGGARPRLECPRDQRELLAACFRRDRRQRRKSQILCTNLSFDFGSTLLDWMEREAPEIHDTVIRADRASVQRIGHATRLAMPFHHIILRSASRRDKETEVRWASPIHKRSARIRRFLAPGDRGGPRDARRRRGGRNQIHRPRAASGVESARAGVAREGGVERRPVDRRVLYTMARCRTTSRSGVWRPMPIADRCAERHAAGCDHEHPGKTARRGGIIHKGGDKALATVLSRLQRPTKLELSNFAAALAAHPPAETVTWSSRPRGAVPTVSSAGARISGDRIDQTVPPHPGNGAPAAHGHRLARRRRSRDLRARRSRASRRALGVS